jgi:hypothetical protein
MRYAAPIILSAKNSGSDATSSAVIPALAASAQIASPLETPSAVNTPPRNPPAIAERTVTAVSGPGVVITSSERPMKAR